MTLASPTALASVLRVQSVSKEYPTPAEPLVVLRGVSFELRPGQTLAIVGPSGSGKSTLLNVLGTIDRPTGGEVTLDGVNAFSLSAKKLAHFRGTRHRVRLSRSPSASATLGDGKRARRPPGGRRGRRTGRCAGSGASQASRPGGTGEPICQASFPAASGSASPSHGR